MRSLIQPIKLEEFTYSRNIGWGEGERELLPKSNKSEESFQMFVIDLVGQPTVSLNLLH